MVVHHEAVTAKVYLFRKPTIADYIYPTKCKNITFCLDKKATNHKKKNLVLFDFNKDC
jgi:hypothetical protein